MDHQLRPSVGMDVIDSGDHLVGTIETVEHDHFVVQKGFFFPQSHRIPISAIGSIADNEVVLRISREVALMSDADVDWADKPHHGEHSEHIPDSSEKTVDAFRSGVDPRRTS